MVNISSVGGKVVLPTYGAYAGSKFALEAVSDALRREVGTAGIKVVVVEPGAVKTEIAERGIATSEGLPADMTAAQLARYGERYGRRYGTSPVVQRNRRLRRNRRQR